MKRFWRVTMVTGLFCLGPIEAQETSPKVPERTVTPVAWPPPHLRDLPPDYLERQHASLAAGTNRLSKLRLTNSKDTDSIGWVRYGMPALILGKRVEEINQFF